MPFGRKAQPSIRWTYGCKPPRENMDLVRQQMRLAHRYRNLLTAIERRRREQVQQTLLNLCPGVLALTDQRDALSRDIDALRSEMKAANAKARKRLKDPARTARLKELRAQRKDVSAKLAAVKAAEYQAPRVQAALKCIDEDAAAYRRWGRAVCGVYWGTYLPVEAAADQARKGRTPPKFHRWTGSASVSVQFQKGISPDEAFSGTDTRIRIINVEHKPNGKMRADVWLRIGSDGRTPVWTIVRATLHRPFPEGCSIKWASLHVQRTGRDEHWELQFVLSRESGWAKTDCAASGTVGIDVGWRLTDEGLRVAYWVGDDGAEGQLILPQREIDILKYVDRLRGERDTAFNGRRESLAEWIKGRTVPDWLKERTRHLSQWRSPARLAGLLLYWQWHRFEGDERIYESLEAWRRRDKEQWAYESQSRRKVSARRREVYRNFAAMIRRRYATVFVEDTNWSNLMRKALPEGDAADAATREHQRLASVGLLVATISETAAETVRVPPQDTTRKCAACGELSGEATPAALYHTCSHCGETWDQDRNAAINLLNGERSCAGGDSAA